MDANLTLTLKAEIMAEKFRTSTEVLEDFLRCMVCFESFKEPKVLQCQHTFCQECLREWNGKGGGGQKGISCPTCRLRTPLPGDDDIAGLPSDFKVTKLCELLTEVSVNDAGEEDRCCDICSAGNIQKVASHFCARCSESFCGSCHQRHAANNLFLNHSVVDLSVNSSSGKLFCKQHVSKPIRYICQQCSIFICTVCAINAHNAHDVQDLESGLSEHAQRLQSLVGRIQDKILEVKAIHEELVEVQVLLKGWQNDIEDKIESEINIQINKIIAAKNELVELLTTKAFPCDEYGDIVWACDDIKECAETQIIQRTSVISNNMKDKRIKLVEELKGKCDEVTKDIAQRVDKVIFHMAGIESLLSFVEKVMSVNNALEMLLIHEDLTSRINSVLETNIETITPLTFKLVQYKPLCSKDSLGTLVEEETSVHQFLARSRLAEAVCTEDEDEEVAEAMLSLEGAIGGIDPNTPDDDLGYNHTCERSHSSCSEPPLKIVEQKPTGSAKSERKQLRKVNSITKSAAYEETATDPWLKKEGGHKRSSSIDSKLIRLNGATGSSQSCDKSQSLISSQSSLNGVITSGENAGLALVPSAPPGTETLLNGKAPPPYANGSQSPEASPFMRTKSLDEATLKKCSTLIKDTIKNCRPRSMAANGNINGMIDFTKSKMSLMWEKEGSLKVTHKKSGLSKRKLSLGSPSTSGLPEIRHPSDACFLTNGDIVIADMLDKNLQVLSADTVMWSKVKDRKQPFVTSRPIAWHHIEPACVMVAPQISREANSVDGELVVCTDVKDKCVKLIDIRSKGSCVAAWGKSWFMPMFKHPSGLAMTNEGKWIISDIGKHSVSIHDPDGRVITQFGSRGKGAYGFEQPKYVAVDHQGRILVSDSGNGGIKVYDKKGQFLFKISSKEVSDLNSPAGICVDSRGNILVADRQRHCVHMFSCDGRYIKQLLSHKNGLRYPVGLAIGTYGQLAVTQLDPPAIKFYECSDFE